VVRSLGSYPASHRRPRERFFTLPNSRMLNVPSPTNGTAFAIGRAGHVLRQGSFPIYNLPVRAEGNLGEITYVFNMIPSQVTDKWLAQFPHLIPFSVRPHWICLHEGQ